MKKIKETTSNTDQDEHLGKIGKHFPVDILLNHLLVRLPAQSVVSCMCVCKEWYDSISNPSFIELYFQNSHLYADTYLIYGRHNSLGLVSCKTFDMVSSYRYPFENFSSLPMEIVGSANGLLCLIAYGLTSKHIYLMNPSIGKYKVIAHGTIRNDTRMILGFGYHQKSCDYKIVRFLKRQQVLDDLFRKYVAEIYSLRRNAWKEIKVDYFPWTIGDEAPSVMYNDHLHWIAFNWDLRETVVLSFNVEKDVLEEVRLPDLGFLLNCTNSKSAVVPMDCLCLFVYVLPMGLAESTRFYIWIMKDYGVAESWTKLYDIEFQVSIQRCISSTQHDQIILEDIGGNILMYNVDTRDFHYLNIPEKVFLVKFAPYKESLFLLDQKNEVLVIQSSSKEHTHEFICSPVVKEEDSDHLELCPEENSNDAPSGQDFFGISESIDEEPSDPGGHICSLQGDKQDCNLGGKSLNLLNDRSEKEGELLKQPSSKGVYSVVHKEGSSDCSQKTEDKTS